MLNKCKYNNDYSAHAVTRHFGHYNRYYIYSRHLASVSAGRRS